MIHTALRTDQIEATVPHRRVCGHDSSDGGIIGELNHHITRLEETLGASFEQHPDADIVRSLPGLGVVLGAWVLGAWS